MPIIFGLGTGRSGTQSLAHLLNEQENSVCFHEINPAGMRWNGSVETVLSLINDFVDIINGGERAVTIDYTSPNRSAPLERLKNMERVNVIGDIGFYYLPYVERVISTEIDVKIPCMKRDKQDVLRSYINKFKVNSEKKRSNIFRKILNNRDFDSIYRNPFIDHNGAGWVKDVKWDKCYPKFGDSISLEDGLSLYWDMYYEYVDVLSNKYPDKVKIFDINEMNTEEGRRRILSFCGCVGAPKETAGL